MKQYFDVITRAQELGDGVQSTEMKALVQEILKKIVTSEQYQPNQLKVYIEQLITGSGDDSAQAKEKKEQLCTLLKLTLSPPFIQDRTDGMQNNLGAKQNKGGVQLTFQFGGKDFLPKLNS